MASHQDNRLSVINYHEALDGVKTQFALARFALNNLSKNRIKEFYKTLLRNRLDTIEHRCDKNGFDETIKKMVSEFEKRKLRKNFRSSDTRFKLELSEDRLNQSELLLLVAHFESFMKQIHEAFLNAAPAKVFSERDTKFMLREAFQNEAEGGSGRFLKELIIKEVKSLDSQHIRKRHEYFEKYFGVGFGTKEDVDDLKEIMDTRNKISHEIYCPPPCNLEHVKDQPLVSNHMLKRACWLFDDIPRRCIDVGARTYPSYFRSAGTK